MASTYDKASLVMIPSGTKASKIFSQKPVNGDGDFTFSRSTAATRVNADGNIEKETQNLLLQSNSFGTTWTKSRTSVTSGQSGYDGTNDAWLLAGNGTGDFPYLAMTLSAYSGVVTFSVYAKAGTGEWLVLRVGGNGTPYVNFNVTTGAVGTTSGSFIEAKTEDAGGGWWRLSITAVASSYTFPTFFINNGNNDFTSHTKNIYIQDAQLEQGLVARDVIETTTAAVEGGITDNVPRLDYTDSSCPALLLEPQRTNLVTQSEYLLGGSGWSAANLDRNANAVVSPEGVQNGTEIVATGSGGHPIYEDLSSTSNGTYTLSMFVKKGVNTSKGDLSDGYSTTSASFDLDTATINADTAQTLNPFIEPYNNGWYRVGYTLAVTANQSQPALYLFDSSGNQNYTANGETMYIYGFQIEAGSYATSYIPTYGTSVTRNADSGQVMNLDTNNIVGGSQWTFFAELEVHNNTPNADKMALTDADSMPRTYLYNTTLGWAGGWTGSSYNLDLNTNSKVAWRLNDSRNGDIFANGALRASITNQSVDMTADRIFLRGAQGKWRLRQIILFPTALTDQELIDLTTI